MCLARFAPRLDITGVDIPPAMVEHVARRVAEAGLADRARFVVGDVGVLPFPTPPSMLWSAFTGSSDLAERP